MSLLYFDLPYYYTTVLLSYHNLNLLPAFLDLVGDLGSEEVMGSLLLNQLLQSSRGFK